MKCRHCDNGVMADFTIEHYHYAECGLPRVWLKDVPARRCNACGSETVRIKGLSSLHRTIALAVLKKPHRLDGDEVRFLRKHIGLSGKDFAKRMGVTPEMVSRWENERKPIGAGSDRLLRLLVKTMGQVESYPVEDLDEIDETVAPIDLTLSHGREWRVSTPPAA